jgi:aminopeptidase N
VEETLWRNLRRAGSPTARAAFFSAYRQNANSPEALARLVRMWRGDEEIADVSLSESDYTSLATTLAIHEVEGWEGIVDEQSGRIENPDRRARFEFERASLSAAPSQREAFFESVNDPSNREREPWVLAALSNLHHPLRAEHAERFILPSLEMVEEIQRTGDIFFPKRWLDANLGGHNTPSAARIVREFLEARPDYPARLRGKILQSADLLERAAAIAYPDPSR